MAIDPETSTISLALSKHSHSTPLTKGRTPFSLPHTSKQDHSWGGNGEAHPSPPLIDYQRLVFLAFGGAGTVYAIDEERVFKEFHDGTMDVERRALKRLGSHPNIVQCFGEVDDGLILERRQSLRTIIQSGANHIPLSRKICWLQQAEEGLAHVHNKCIIHADVGCHNMTMKKEDLKIIDFEGCSIDGEEAGACYEWCSYIVSTPAISRKTDIFAFGCAMYEMITGKQPHDELLESKDKMRLSGQMYAENRFPKVENM
ncbi:kinase-like protein [Aulographum hederae CBS 113979]|uniref:Kinase-like protein n=1 Tax=Aulographum hederae CBS 113979 TaxID=1176131 RepID=A0A6G1H7D4_9PEZI|nr:kinase-like protein [Aulographum hederae CBS 113979]